MRAGSQEWEKSRSFNLFQAGAEMTCAFTDMLSANRLNESMKGTESFFTSGTYDQDSFRYLLKSESTRSKISGRFCQILLMYSTDAQGRIVLMDSHVVKAVMVALSRSLRETDYIGWYRDGHIVGAVLTLMVRESMAQVSAYLQSRLLEILRADLSVEEISRLQIRVCQHHELESIESG